MDGIPVGQIAVRAGVDAWTIRFYEKEQLLPKAKRSASGYRLYGADMIDRVRFIKKAQHLGLSLREIREILELSDRGHCPCGHVEKLLKAKLDELQAKIEDLKSVETRIRQVFRKPQPTATPRGKAICQKIEQHHEPDCCPPGPQPIRVVKRRRKAR